MPVTNEDEFARHDTGPNNCPGCGADLTDGGVTLTLKVKKVTLERYDARMDGDTVMRKSYMETEEYDGDTTIYDATCDNCGLSVDYCTWEDA